MKKLFSILLLVGTLWILTPSCKHETTKKESVKKSAPKHECKSCKGNVKAQAIIVTDTDYQGDPETEPTTY